MSEAASALRVKSIDHVTVVVKDLERSHAFYADVLGMQPVDRPNFAFAGSWFQAGPTQIHLILEHAESPPAGLGPPGDTAAGRGHHFAFEVADARAAATTLEARGVTVVQGPQNRPDGVIQLYVRDPDGHVVELFSCP